MATDNTSTENTKSLTSDLGISTENNKSLTSDLASNSSKSSLTSSSSSTGDLSYQADYNDLESGVNTIESAVKDINSGINDCNRLVKDIFTESTFMGPFADYCYGTWNGLSELTVQTNNNFSTSAQILDSNTAAYSESDKSTGEKVGDV